MMHDFPDHDHQHECPYVETIKYLAHAVVLLLGDKLDIEPFGGTSDRVVWGNVGTALVQAIDAEGVDDTP